MKKLLLLTAIFLTYFVSNTEAKYRYHYHRNYIDVNYFFGALEPYGEWIEIGYDEFVWRPYDVGRYWKPYSEGRWEWTISGWHWVSYEPFGWATYHYGRWFYDDYYGWVWMPGNKWAPAWVEWRYNDNYIGWSPLPPYADFRPNYGIRFSIRWNSGYNYWNFVSYRNFYTINVNNYFVDNYTVRNIYKRTKYRTNYFTNNNRIVNGGINRRFIERRSGVRIKTREVYKTSSRRELSNRAKTNRREVITYRPNKNELKKHKSFDRNKIRKSNRKLNLRRDKVAIKNRTPREINKTNRRSVKNKRTELRKLNSRNKTYKPLVRKSVTPRERIYNKNRETNRNEIKRNKTLHKVTPLKKGTSKREVFNRKNFTNNRHSTIKKNNMRKNKALSKSKVERKKKKTTKRREVIKRR
jgi:hypothetical protein